MVKNIIKDTEFLQQVAEPATRKDKAVAEDLLDTLKANRAICVGLAANMIGVAKSIIAVQVGKQNVAMLNPQIVKHSEEYSEVMEGCLSLLGERPAKRYEWIEVEYKDIRFKPQKQRFSGFTAQIIQHEIDHCQGILI
ncbi:peptide deformylase [Selenomonas ruminantium]|uniref:Peptide deformylase n=1 Tax=Selenomonas ruminantium TaxID=971 RepID=A0A1H0TP15_SELRU|nr:peptide deformylase [Selenomonas ruminantium]SDP55764.1 peptide deformylase [Selenomonas ruminantium]